MNAVKIVYLSNGLYKKSGGGKLLSQLIKNINRVIYSCDISQKITLGSGLQLPHQGNGVTIGPNATIGNNVTICMHVTLAGAKWNGQPYEAPRIGDNVMLGTGCVILGGISIGNNCLVGANAVVTENVPDNCTVVGIPGKIIKRGDRE